MVSKQIKKTEKIEGKIEINLQDTNINKKQSKLVGFLLQTSFEMGRGRIVDLALESYKTR